jgi:transcriptional regulator with XRE-family HTH domain
METIHPLRAYREKCQPPLSRAALADQLGVGRPTLFRWESGSRKIDESLLPHVSKTTGIPAKELRPDLFEQSEKLFGEQPQCA